MPIRPPTEEELNALHTPLGGEPQKRNEVSRRGLLRRGGLIGLGVVALGGAAILRSGERTELDSEFHSSDGRFSSENNSFGRRVAERKESFGTDAVNHIFLHTGYGPVRVRTLEENDSEISPGIPERGAASLDALNPEWLELVYRRAGIPIPETGPECELRPMTTLEIVRYYGESPERGVAYGIGERSPMRYVREHIYAVTEGLPEWMRHELPSVIPALIALESGFNNNAVSKSNARSAVQFMPPSWATIQRRLRRPLDEHKLEDLVAFVGAYFLDSYEHLSRRRHNRHTAGIALNNIKRLVFNDHQELFEKNFLFPVLINSYNTGVPIIGNALAWFENYIESFETGEGVNRRNPFLDELRALSTNGHAVYDRFTLAANSHNVSSYGEDASDYVLKIWAFRELIDALELPA